MQAIPFGLVADVGGTNTRLARVDKTGVILDSVQKHPNKSAGSFEDMARRYLDGGPPPSHVVIAVAGPVAGRTARLTNLDWDFDTDELRGDLQADRVTLINDLEALGQAVPGVAADAVEPLHTDAELGRQGQALVVGVGTGFNVSPVETRSGTVFSAEMGHASLPAPVREFLASRVPDVSVFETVENLFSGVGLLRLATVLGLEADSAEDVVKGGDPRGQEALEICTEAFGLMVRELAYAYFPRAGLFFNGSLAQELLTPERRGQVLAPLRGDKGFGGQFSSIPAFLFTSHTVALGGCAARMLADLEAA